MSANNANRFNFYKKNQSVFSITPAIVLGLEDSVTPCALVTLVVFVMLLSRLGGTYRKVLCLGALFLVTAFVTKFSVIFGILDVALSSVSINKAIRVVYLVVGIGFIVFGILHLMDWVRCKQGNDGNHFLIKLPVILKEAVSPAQRSQNFLIRLLKIVGLIYLFMFSGITFVFMSSIWAQDYLLYWMVYALLANKEFYAASSAVSFSVFMFMLPLLVSWLAMIWITKSSRARAQLTKSVRVLKLSCSALYLTIGVGLIVGFV